MSIEEFKNVFPRVVTAINEFPGATIAFDAGASSALANPDETLLVIRTTVGRGFALVVNMPEKRIRGMRRHVYTRARRGRGVRETNQAFLAELRRRLGTKGQTNEEMFGNESWKSWRRNSVKGTRAAIKATMAKLAY